MALFYFFVPESINWAFASLVFTIMQLSGPRPWLALILSYPYEILRVLIIGAPL